MRKKGFVLTVLLAVFLVTCLQGFAGGRGEASAAGTLKVWVFGAANFIPGYNKLFREFEVANPGLKVNRVDMGWDELNQKLITGFATGGDLPDLTEVPVTWVSPYITLEQFAEVPASVMSKAEIDKTHWPQTTVFLLHNGKYYGLPSSYTTDKIGILFNRKLWREAGVTPGNFKNWEEFMKTAQKLTKRDASGNITQAGLINHGGEEEETIMGWTLQYGGKILSEDGKRWTFNTPAGKKALQTYIDVFEKWKVDDPKFPAWESFPQEQAASQLVGPWYGAVLTQEHPSIEWGFFPQPKITDSPPYFVLTVGWVRVVPKVSKNKEAAFKWLKFMTDIERAVYWELSIGELSAIKEATTHPDVLKDPALGPIAPLLPYGVAVDLRNGEKFRDMYYGTLDELLLGKISQGEFLQKVEEEGNKILAEYK